MVYANDSKSFDRKVMWVQVPPPAQSEAIVTHTSDLRHSCGGT